MDSAALKPRSGYHHGDLPTALRVAAIEIVRESGLAGFSLSKAAKRVGVSSGAPYQHYRDGDALLADVATQGYRDLRAAMSGIAAGDPVERLGKLAAAQTLFARHNPEVFAVMCHCGLEPDTDPELAAEASRAVETVREAACEVCGPAGAHELALASIAVAQGFSQLSTDECLAAGATPDQMADRARDVVTLLARGAAG